MILFSAFLFYSTLCFWTCIFYYISRSVYCYIKKRRRNYKLCFYSDCPKYRTCKFNLKVLIDI